MQVEIPVIFRKRQDGEIIALLPTYVGSDKNSCRAFTKDHGEVSIDTSVMRMTVEPDPSEYQELLAFIAHRGYYPLKICKRIKEHMNIARYRSQEHIPISRMQAA